VADVARWKQKRESKKRANVAGVSQPPKRNGKGGRSKRGRRGMMASLNLRSTGPSRLGGWLKPATSARWTGAGKGTAVPGRGRRGMMAGLNLRSTGPSRLGGWLTPATSARWTGAGKRKAVPGRPVEVTTTVASLIQLTQIFLMLVVEGYLQNKYTMKMGQTIPYPWEDQSGK